MRVEPLGQGGVWGVSGELDPSYAADLAQALSGELEADRDVILDLSDVTFIESTCLGVLIGARKRAGIHRRRLALRTNASPQVMKVLDLTGVGALFEWVDDDDDGPAGVREPRRPRPPGGQPSVADTPG